MAAMENVLDLYAEPYDPQRPVVCFDETTTQLLADLRPSIPGSPGAAQTGGLRVPEGRDPQTCSLPASPAGAGARWLLPNSAPCGTSPSR